MKRFIIISLLSAITLPILACAWIDNHNYYLFSMYAKDDFRDRVERICNDNWKAYLGSTNEYFWFDAEEVIKAAQQKGDALMVSYVQNLQKYLDCVDIEQRKQYEWNYPTKEDLAAQKRNLEAVNAYAFSKLKTKLRSQHALLYMRCNMMQGRHHANITFWEQTASQYIETVYKDMMKNIYAGALYKTGREAEAGELFAEMGDYTSLMTQFYKKRSYLAISQHYKQNPNSKALPFLLQDFVNNAQEAEDLKNGTFGGKLFIRDINQQESWQMQQFCELVVREGKTETPIMWKSAKAWLEYLSGKKKDALKDINAAMKMEGTERMKDNARILKFYISAAQAKHDDDFDNYVAEELKWLKAKQEEGFDLSYHAMDRLSHQIIMPLYQDKPEQQLALMLITGNEEYANRIDTMRVDRLEKFLFYTNTPAKSSFDKYLKANIHVNDSDLIELIGTKYMRLAQWDKAIQWLKDIPIDYYNQNRTKPYLYYSVVRQWNVEPWTKRQWVKDSEIYDHDVKWWKHRKLDFCKEMQMMEGSLNVLKGKALEQRYYNLATYYAQANIKGDCWWLLCNAKSVYDTIRVNEVDFGARAVEYLQKAATTSDIELKMKALFAMGYRELYTASPNADAKLWFETRWSSNPDDDGYVTIYHRQAPQFRAYQSLFSLVENKREAPQYISRCDDFLQFRKYYRTHK